MASLKEIKGRIASVGNTLKITSAMKMVSSAKLHRTQSVAAALERYNEELKRLSDALSQATAESQGRSTHSEPITSVWSTPFPQQQHAVVVALASDSSLCGSFNNNVIKALQSELKRLEEAGYDEITIYPIGEKMAQAVEKRGLKANYAYRNLMGKLDYTSSAELANELMEAFRTGSCNTVSLVYNHLYSLGHQAPIEEQFLPMPLPETTTATPAIDYLFEPKAEALIEELIPYTLRTKLHTVLLDSSVAEHAARMIAMQTATDNASALLEELRLSYNKRRQQAITEELADITQAAEGQ